MKFLESTRSVASLAIIIAAFSVAYFLVVNANIHKREMDIKEADRLIFDDCLVQAMNEYKGQWSFQCVQAKKDSHCTSLPGYISADIDKNLKENKLNCAKLYK